MRKRSIERRKFIRFDFDASIKFKLSESSNVDKSMEAKAKNLSAEGLCIVTEKEIPRDRNIELNIFLPGKKRAVRVHGKIIWTHRVKGADKSAAGTFESGIKLYTVDKDDENTLLRYYCDRMVDNLSKYMRP